MTTLISDKRLFAIVLYTALFNHDNSIRDIWKDSRVTGAAAASLLGLVGVVFTPIILSAIIEALGFGVGGVAVGSFGSWFMSLHGGFIKSGSLVSILQSVGAAGFGTLGISLSSSFGATIGILIGAIGGSKLATYFREMDLNEFEQHSLRNFVKIEENEHENMIMFTLMPALLYNETMLRFFVETFMTCSLFSDSKLFRLDFVKENKVNNTIYNLLINNYEESRLEYIVYNDHLNGYNLDLNNYKSSDNKMNLLVEIWMALNRNINLNIDLEKIHEKVKKFSGYIYDIYDNYHKYYYYKLF